MEGFTEHYLLDKFSSQRTAVALPSKESSLQCLTGTCFSERAQTDLSPHPKD